MSWMACGRPHLPVGRAGLTLVVDAGAHDGRPELLGQGQERVEPGAGGVALLQVDRVDDGPAADPRQGRLDHGRLGGVDHQRRGGLGGEPAGDLLHVGHAVGAGVVDAHVDDVGALLDLLLGHGHAGVPVGLEHRLAELLRAVGVGALADHQERGVLGEGDVGVDGGRAGLGLGVPDGRGQVGAGLDHGRQVRRAWCRSSRR